ncbi:MAG: Do family serine endopeptidase [Acidobacteria bacterium]|nr:Do family serine endopeptidase [Acidobacteriota bacterium]
MTTSVRSRYISYGAVAIGALVLGLVLAGGLQLTPRGDAREAAPAAITSASQAIEPVAALPSGTPDFASLAERVLPSVVSVYTEEKGKQQQTRRAHPQMDPFEFFFGPNGLPGQQQPRRQGAGSGFFIRADGLVMTNNHVVDGADTIKVRLFDNTEIVAKVVGRDPATDIALIRVETKGTYQPLTLGNSDNLRVGEWVMAVGNPLAMGESVSVGVVSAKGRALGLSPETQSFENFIQTDAAINLGNSGGPLINLRGEVVGINTAINAAGQNLGFAVPVNAAKMVIPQLESKGKVTRGYLGVTIKNIDQKTQEAFNLKNRDGAFVDSLSTGGPAAKAGVKEGDVIVGVAGTAIKETRTLIDKVSSVAPGQKVDLDIIRDGKKTGATVTLGQRPDDGATGEGDDTSGDTAGNKLGFEVEDLSPRLRRMFEIPNEIDGAVVTAIGEGSAAEEGGLRRGDIILRVNNRETGSAEDVTGALKPLASGSLVRLYVFRPQANQRSFVIVRIP